MLSRPRSSSRRLPRQRGMSAIEFTLALPFMLLMFAIFIEFGRIYIQYTTLTKAVQDGARYAASSNASSSEIKNIVVYGKADGSGDPVLPALTASMVDIKTSTNYISVTIDYTYAPLLLNTAQFDDDSIFEGLNNLNKLLGLEFSASAVMRDSL